MKESNKKSVYLLTQGAAIAAIYIVLTLIFAPISFGPVQFRISEALCVLPFFTPAAIPGLAIGCLVANLFGLLSGANLIGVWDLVLGPLATLVAAFLTRALGSIRLKGLPILATLPPVLFNAAAVGWELTFVLFEFSWPLYGINALQVALGQFAACTICGLLLATALEKSGAARVIFGAEAVKGKGSGSKRTIKAESRRG